MVDFNISCSGMGGVGAFELEGQAHKGSTRAKRGYGHVPTETVRDTTAGLQGVEQCRSNCRGSRARAPMDGSMASLRGGRARSAAVG